MRVTRQCEFDRFMRHVQPDHESGCWIWTGSFKAGGYGRWEDTQAHRWLFAYQNDGLPPSVHVHHEHCKNHACVNPAHMKVLVNSIHSTIHGHLRPGLMCVNGHPLDDTNTAISRNTRRVFCRACARERRARRFPDRKPRTQLTADDVREIRRLYATGGVFYHELGQQFGISKNATHLIVVQKTWRHVS